MPRDRGHRSDLEEQINDLDHEDATLLVKPQSKPRIEDVELEGIPAIKTPGYGNWIWAEQQCARRNGLTREEVDMVQELFRLYQEGRNLAEFLFYLQTKFQEIQNAFMGKDKAYSPSTLVGGVSTPEPTTFTDIKHAIVQKPVIAQQQRKFKFSGSTLGLYVGTLSLLKPKSYFDTIYDRIRFLKTAADLIDFMKEEIEPLLQSSPRTHQHLSTGEDPEAQHGEEGIQTDSFVKPHPVSLHDFNPHNSDGIMVEPQKKPEVLRDMTENSTRTPGSRVGDLSKLNKQKLDNIIRRLVSARSKDEDVPQSYLVIGRFPKGSNNPTEKLLLLDMDEVLFKTIRKGARSVRGWRTYASFKTLKRFGLYKCDISNGCHLKLDLSQQHQSTLSQFFLAYQASYWHPDAIVAKAWTDWVHKNLNANSSVAFEGKYSLELVYGWSPTRLTFAVSLAVLLSFGIGLGYMLKTGDVSTAWTIASYVVTAAGAVIALIAILGSLNEG